MYHELRKRGTGRYVRLPAPALLLVTDRKQARLKLTDIVAAAVAAGCRWVSLREKDLTPAQQIDLAMSLKPLMQPWNARLTLHGNPELAAAAGLAGVHLPAGSNASHARALLGAAALVGQSVHAVAEARSLDPALVDYAIAGPAFETASKPGYGPALGVDGLAAIVAGARVPIIAIGGIVPDMVVPVTATGAAGIAVMGGVMRAADPGREVQALIAALPLYRPQLLPR